MEELNMLKSKTLINMRTKTIQDIKHLKKKQIYMNIINLPKV